MKIKLSKKQKKLYDDIVGTDIHNIEVLGSTQSGKTYDICIATIFYAQALFEYDPNTCYQGCVVGWTIDTLKSNIVENLTQVLDDLGFKKDKDYQLKWSGDDNKYLKIWNFKLFFFGFNNITSFNKVQGKPLIYVWIDESAMIYTQAKLREAFDKFPTRQTSYADHPYLKTVHSFNVEGGDKHPYKIKYLDNNPTAKKYVFYPYDNPKICTKEAIDNILKMFQGTLRDQKIFNKWVIAEGRVFNKIPTIKKIDINYTIRDIGIGIDYGSVNPTTFVPIALMWHSQTNRWKIVRLGIYYHDPSREGDTPTTEFYSQQLRFFLKYLGEIYPHRNLTNKVLDSEATHFHNRLIADGIGHELSKKGAGSVNEGVEHLQSLFYNEYLEILDTPSIRYFTPDGKPVFSGKDEGLIELQSYRYDTIQSSKTGINCYVKELDHSIDALRYIIRVFNNTGRCPRV